jgi:hypothetical protein
LPCSPCRRLRWARRPSSSPQPLLLGMRVVWQGASIDATVGAQIGNAVTYVHW